MKSQFYKVKHKHFKSAHELQMKSLEFHDRKRWLIKSTIMERESRESQEKTIQTQLNLITLVVPNKNQL